MPLSLSRALSRFLPLSLSLSLSPPLSLPPSLPFPSSLIPSPPSHCLPLFPCGVCWQASNDTSLKDKVWRTLECVSLTPYYSISPSATTLLALKLLVLEALSY